MKTRRELQVENDILIDCIRRTLWIARRYAHGRHTYDPSNFRNVFNKLKEIGVYIARME